MLIDPHVNPQDLSPNELIDKMIEASMDGAVITCTHSALKAVPYIKALLDDEFVCYVGVELCTIHGELVFIPEEANEQFFNEEWAPQGNEIEELAGEELWSLEALQRKLQNFKGVQMIVHPYSRLNDRAWGDRAFTLTSIDAVETRIGRGMAQRDHLCDQIAEIRSWSRVGSSNGNCQFLGTAATVVHEDVDTQESLCEALRKGVCWPIEFEDPMFPRQRYQGVIEDEGPRKRSFAERERKESLNKVNKQKGFHVEEPITTQRKGGRWGQSQHSDTGAGSHRTQSSRNEGRSKNSNRNQQRTSR